MSFKLFAGIFAATMLLLFLGSIVFKLKEISLGVVVLIGVAMMIYELVENLRSNDD